MDAARHGTTRITPRAGWVRVPLLLLNLGFPAALAAAGFPAWMLAIESVLLVLLAYALLYPTCPWLGPIVARFRPDGREVWLTIDDGPFGAETERLAEALQSRDAPATFFLIGQRLADPVHAAAARRLLDLGHGIGNHTHAHRSATFAVQLPGTLEAEIDRCAAALATLGLSTRLFRSPVGFKHAWLHRALTKRRLRFISWSVRAHDGLRCDPAVVLGRISARTDPGAILLLHEGRARSVETILAAVDHLIERGFRFVIPPEDRFL
jgi:peptidoglycan/xylan/chitin deacetylase (PgdA/CDA1 family)